MKSFLVFFTIFLLSRSGFLFANVIGTDLQNFNPTTDGLDFVTVQSAETLEPGVVNLGLFFNYAVNTLPYYTRESTQSRININDTLLYADFSCGVGLLKNLDAGISIPRVLRQRVEDPDYHFEYSGAGLTEVRVNAKYRFFSRGLHGFATVFSINKNLIGNNPYTGIDSGLTYNLELVYDTVFKSFALAVNAGYRKRNSGSAIPGSPVVPFRDQYIVSAGVSYYVARIDSKLIAEIFSGFPAERVEYQPNRSQESMELLTGIKHDLTRNLSFHVGGATKLINGNASPDWRVYTGLNWSFGPLRPRPARIFRISSGKLLYLDDPFDQEPSGNVESFVMENVLFAFNSDSVRESSKGPLGKLVKYMQRPPNYKKLVVEGHTDSVGSGAYNLSLSKRRARNIVDFMIRHFGLKPATIQSVGFGETRPIADNGNYQGRQLNRRVQFTIIRNK